jgi:outer membrane protein assembly factor BamB
MDSCQRDDRRLRDSRESTFLQSNNILTILQSINLPILRPLLLALVIVVPVAATDWPQYLGPARDGVYGGPALSESWPASGPNMVWRKHIGDGLAGVAVAQGRLILFHRIADQEVVDALDPLTGASQWRHSYSTTYKDDFGFDEGPRAVPVVADGVVYTFGAEGQLRALDLRSGKLLWNVDTARRFDVPKGFFGAAGSPLVESGRVMANIGGKGAGVVAFDAKTGNVLWVSTSDGASYSSGVGATLSGRRYAVFLTRDALIGLDPATGGMRFRRPWRARQAASVNAATPLVGRDAIFVSAEYGPGAGVFRCDGTTLSDVWTAEDVLSNHYATSVHHEGRVFGFHGRQEFGPVFRAIRMDNGEVLWTTERFGAGSVILAGNRLVIMRENGELVLASASSTAFEPVARAQILPATVRAYPALAHGVLYVRNGDTLAAVDLRK